MRELKRKAEAKKKPGLDKKDVTLMAARAILSAVPGGGAVAQILSGLKPSYAKQLIEDVQEIDKRLLEKRVPVFSIETLKQDESFGATITHWVHIAVRTTNQKKREALRNAVVNSAMKSPPDDDLRSMFFKWVDDLEPWHLKILEFLDDPKVWARRNAVTFPQWWAISVSNVLREMFPDLKDRVGFYIKGLVDKELLIKASYEALQSAETALSSWTTSIGRQFLSFITSADDEGNLTL